MQNSNRPRRLPKPFGAQAGSGFIAQVPIAAQSGGRASYEQGFPPETFQPVASGGTPPAGQDVNGVLFDATGAAMWAAAGGIAMFDANFATAIGGYPAYALVASSTAGRIYQSTQDNNTTDPDSAQSSGWTTLIDVNAGGGGSSSLVQNGGYVVEPSGLKRCWGLAFSPANSTITINLPVAHTSWVVPVGSCSIPQDEQSIGVVGPVGSPPTGFSVRNGNPKATTFYWHTYGV